MLWDVVTTSDFLVFQCPGTYSTDSMYRSFEDSSGGPGVMLAVNMRNSGEPIITICGFLRSREIRSIYID